MTDNVPPEDTFKILLATDNHLGYGEKDAVRENDTFNTFEEILQIAVAEEVDFILLGGDLFHETRPSTPCMKKCIQLIKKYCFGDKPVEIEFLSDPSLHFENALVNYEDPNINISIPIFSIHGNHDDPTGKSQTSAMEVLAINGLVNYFGRQDDVTKVIVNPILLRKGTTRLALYGLSHVRDERLARLFLSKNVIMRTPEDVNDWFNIFILHQNRANRGVKNYIPESVIPDFFDLVMWGHEHDCQINPESVGDYRAYITQPGSSVATSLAEGEALPKKVGILRVHDKNFHITPVKLRTVRPFVFRTMTLQPPGDEFDGKVTHADRVKARLKQEVDGMIEEAMNLGKHPDLLPLIRLVVKYEDDRQVFNPIIFGQNFAERVANPLDLLKFSSMLKKYKRSKRNFDDDLDGIEDEEDVNRVEDLIPKYCKDLQVLSLTGLSEAVKRFIDSNDTGAPEYLISNQEEYTLNKVLELDPSEDDIDGCIERLRTVRSADDFKKILADPNRPKISAGTDNLGGDVMIIDDDDNPSTSSGIPVKGGPGSRGRRGSRGGRGSRGPRGRAK